MRGRRAEASPSILFVCIVGQPQALCPNLPPRQIVRADTPNGKDFGPYRLRLRQRLLELSFSREPRSDRVRHPQALKLICGQSVKFNRGVRNCTYSLFKSRLLDSRLRVHNTPAKQI
jgi:hypothetical protein